MAPPSSNMSSSIPQPVRRTPPGGHSTFSLTGQVATTPSSKATKEVPVPGQPAKPLSRGARTLVSNIVFGDDTTHATQQQLQAVAQRKQAKKLNPSRIWAPSALGILPTVVPHALKSPVSPLSSGRNTFAAEVEAKTPVKSGRSMVPNRKRSTLTAGFFFQTAVEENAVPQTYMASATNKNKGSLGLGSSDEVAAPSAKTCIKNALKNKSDITFGTNYAPNNAPTTFSGGPSTLKHLPAPASRHNGRSSRSSITFGEPSAPMVPNSLSFTRKSISSLAEFAGFGTSMRSPLPVHVGGRKTPNASALQGAAGVSSGKFGIY
ncbi:hypothetical protein BC830DRAFT_214718 [Chytriomyces sp. MP71]|nr:hypothetical protein BC830DRAFT_214718 [Chytriomyces sp. MP71]